MGRGPNPDNGLGSDPLPPPTSPRSCADNNRLVMLITVIWRKLYIHTELRYPCARCSRRRRSGAVAAVPAEQARVSFGTGSSWSVCHLSFSMCSRSTPRAETVCSVCSLLPLLLLSFPSLPFPSSLLTDFLHHFSSSLPLHSPFPADAM